MPLNTLPRTEFGSGFSVTAADMAPGMATRLLHSSVPTVATTGTTELLIIVPVAGTIVAAAVAFKDALAAHATAILTFAIVNKGQAGAGTTALLAATDANTSKTSTGTAISAYTTRNLTLHGTAANLVVAAGDVLAVTFTSATTLANTLT